MDELRNEEEPPVGQVNLVGENMGIESDEPRDRVQWPEPVREPKEEPSHERIKDGP